MSNKVFNRVVDLCDHMDNMASGSVSDTIIFKSDLTDKEWVVADVTKPASMSAFQKLSLSVVKRFQDYEQASSYMEAVKGVSMTRESVSEPQVGLSDSSFSRPIV